jgi:hypothetical protein
VDAAFKKTGLEKDEDYDSDPTANAKGKEEEDAKGNEKTDKKGKEAYDESDSESESETESEDKSEDGDNSDEADDGKDDDEDRQEVAPSTPAKQAPPTEGQEIIDITDTPPPPPPVMRRFVTLKDGSKDELHYASFDE